MELVIADRQLSDKEEIVVLILKFKDCNIANRIKQRYESYSCCIIICATV